MEIPLELSPQGRVLGRIRPAGQRRGTLLRLAKRLPKRRECRTVQNHRLIELLDQTLEHIGGKTLPGLALDPRWNLGQGIQSVEVTANMHECVERDQNWAGERTERVLKEGVGLTLIVESRGGKRAQFRTVQGRHESRVSMPPPAVRPGETRGHESILRQQHAKVKRIDADHAAGWKSMAAARRAEQFRGSAGDA